MIAGVSGSSTVGSHPGRRDAGGLLRRARTRAEVDRAHEAIRRIGELSDNIVSIGPFGIGLDGILAWVPFVGTAYSLGAGGLLLAQGWRAHAGPLRMTAAAGLMLARTAVGGVPIVGDVVVDLLRGHRFAARLLRGGVERTLYVEASERHASADPRLRREIDAARSARRRVVFLDAGQG